MTEPTTERPAHRQRCGICHKVHPVGFWVPGEVWGKVVPVQFQQDIVCLACFITYADEILYPWDDIIAFYPVSLATHLNDPRSPMDRGMHVRADSGEQTNGGDDG